VRQQKVALSAFCIMNFMFNATNNQEPIPTNETTANKKVCFESCRIADGKTLKECFKELSHQEKIQLFEELSFEQKEEFFKCLDFCEYVDFLDDFNEYDWTRIIKKIPKEKRLYWWTKPIYKQRALIQKVHKELLQEYAKRKSRL
jgi:hypothetical protein